jgi:cytochrome oxidase Cu insertion factor (SCO1/SenC/PrrC family)
VSARLKLLLIFLACASPFGLGWAAWYFGWGTGSPGNYGELIEGRALTGAPFEELRGKWVLVAFDHADCDAGCERKLYFMRQVRTAQGKDQGRIERLWVITGGGAPDADVLASFAGTRVSRMQPQGFPGDPSDHVYLVDPLGNLVLRFPKDPDPSKMLKDVQRLLRYSRIG